MEENMKKKPETGTQIQKSKAVPHQEEIEVHVRERSEVSEGRERD